MTDLRQHFFSNRIVNKWNLLSEDIISASSLNNFKGKLQRLYNDGSSTGFFKSAWPSGLSQFPGEAQSYKLSGKLYHHATSVTGLLYELGWLPLFERRKHSCLTVFYKAFNNLSAISLDHLSVSSQHTGASNDNKFMSLPVHTDVFKYSFFLGPLPIGIPSHWLFVSRSRFSPSMGVCWAPHPPTFADHHDTAAVTGGLHPLLDISQKNRRKTH